MSCSRTLKISSSSFISVKGSSPRSAFSARCRIGVVHASLAPVDLASAEVM